MGGWEKKVEVYFILYYSIIKSLFLFNDLSMFSYICLIVFVWEKVVVLVFGQCYVAHGVSWKDSSQAERTGGMWRGHPHQTPALGSR